MTENFSAKRYSVTALQRYKGILVTEIHRHVRDHSQNTLFIYIIY